MKIAKKSHSQWYLEKCKNLWDVFNSIEREHISLYGLKNFFSMLYLISLELVSEKVISLNMSKYVEYIPNFK